MLLLVITGCQSQKSAESKPDWQSFIVAQDLKGYEYLFIIHISPHDCLGCLHLLGHLNQLQERINANGENSLVAIAGEDSEAFWNIYNSFQLAITYINAEELTELKLPALKTTPYVYFVDLHHQRLIYHDVLPKEEVTFLALVNLVEKYSGVLF
jgi:hypothetical protein